MFTIPWQFSPPLNSSGQVHRKPLLVKPAWQVPPFKHGPLSQWFKSIANINEVRFIKPITKVVKITPPNSGKRITSKFRV